MRELFDCFPSALMSKFSVVAIAAALTCSEAAPNLRVSGVDVLSERLLEARFFFASQFACFEFFAVKAVTESREEKGSQERLALAKTFGVYSRKKKFFDPLFRQGQGILRFWRDPWAKTGV